MASSDYAFFTNLPADMDEGKLQSIFGAYGNISSIKVIPGQGGVSALIQFGSVEEASWIVENLNGNLAQGLPTPIQVRFGSPADAADSGKGGWGGGGKGGGWGKDSWGGGGNRWTPYGNKGGGDSWSKGGGGGKSQGKGGGIAILKKGLKTANVLPGGKWTNDENALFIGGLPYDTTDCDLYEIFSPFGAIPAAGVRAMTHEDGSCRGIGFVNFLDSTAAQTAIATLNGTMMPDGTTLRVCTKGAPGQRSGGK
mmetsp:Transcript_58196/g.123573  ORF Transcript_58196/g.123573 Transcript_58196/m.123573 type:complete len:253 (-) Transcript_58196:36-794(-)|eukprot:CAMPEP_0206477686 /NCGR_PEP_ID=MMETSP0324_2-20121206/35567_1 /ASSEMBLY_ACC=CAM_ASM_000836 /TAXON_ID=2866 /ORGANISM="Crypthecodinium cohnii, Strain Seligo" /LENGTH=252 /DNA_ID=CAMNT_0053953771 /DNA_START=190 /DNA_END=948 /DNA_ORIENTATION=+